MKKLIAIAAIVFATSASAASVNGSSHDMALFVGGTGGVDVCYYCHAAHHTTADSAPLWARNAWSSTGYTFYSSSTISANVSTLDVVSAACMTCHDGTVAVNETIKGTYGTATKITTGNNLIGQALTNDHPVNLAWVEGKAGLGASSSIGSFKLYNTSGGAAGISCASCHQVHDNVNGKFLRVALSSADFCATCHSAK